MVLARRQPGKEEEQVTLSPEDVRGNTDKDEFIYKIRAKSMSRLDPTVRSKRFMEFMTNVVPALANTAMMLMQLGMPFNLQHALTMAGEELDIGDRVQELLTDPDFQEKLANYLAMIQNGQGGGQAGAGTPGSTRKAGPQAGIMQNGGYDQKRLMTSPQQDSRSAAQGGAPQAGV
jgi:hypothetical protein